MIQIPANHVSTDQVMIINPDGSVSYEPNTRYQQPTIIRRSYQKPPRPKYRYTIEQEGKAYRLCQWCRYWCTRRCPTCDCCDRILACPLLCCILSALLLFFLFVALLTLFGLHPNINPSRRFYGIISTLSIDNTTVLIYGLDKPCNITGQASICLNITTSTSITRVATTIVTSRAVITTNCSFVLLAFCTIIYSTIRKTNYFI